MKKVYLIILLSAISIFGFSQGYNTSLGLRLESGTAGVTFKTGGGGNAFEGIIKTDFDNWLAFTALFERYQPIQDVDNLFFYYGGGGGISISEGSKIVDNNNDGRITESDKIILYYDSYGRPVYGYEYKNTFNKLGLGIDGILGIEYALKSAPFAFSLDWKPYLQIYDGIDLHALEFGISIRYIIN